MNLPTDLNIYLAGKITKHGWRKNIVSGVDEDEVHNYVQQYNKWPVTKNGVMGMFDYTGPYFVRCDHGCYHGNGDHGVGINKNCQSSLGDFHYTQSLVYSLCMDAIKDSLCMFAWIDGEDIYGTIAEIGYAHGLGNCYICVAGPRRYTELWMVYQMADVLILDHQTPREAFSAFVSNGTKLFHKHKQSPNEKGFSSPSRRA